MSLDVLVRPGCKEVSQRKLEVYDKYCKVIQWGRSNPVRFCSRFMGVEMLDFQSYVTQNTWAAMFALWLKSRNAGKALYVNTIIPTPSGNKMMKDICVGDYIYDQDGNPTRVTYVSPIFIGNDCYEVTFDDGEIVIADADHLWQVKESGIKNGLDEYGLITRNTAHIFTNYYLKRADGKGTEYKYKVPKSMPLYLPEAELPIDPYVFGAWLGDGESKGNRVTCGRSDVDIMQSLLSKSGYKIIRHYNSDGNYLLTVSGRKIGNRDAIRQALKDLGVWGNKHIPDIYLNSSIEQRFALLRGLMDTDGCVGNHGDCEFAQKSKQMIDGFTRLLDSLSIRYSVSDRYVLCNGKSCHSYRVHFFSDKESCVFEMPRKIAKLPERLNNRSFYKSIVCVKKVQSVPTKCLAVDNPRSLYLFGKHPTVTHNTTELAIYTMLRSVLIPFHSTYFLGNTGSQAKETYSKIEKITKREIESFTGSTEFFMDEICRNGPTGDGFTHSPESFSFKLFNGSTVNTLNSDITNIKGRRANLVCFDEAGWFSDELFVQAEQFVNQDENFKLGGNIDVSLEPKGFPRQLLYASSASDTSSEFYKKFRNFSERMLMGDTKYFACNIDIDTVMKAKFHGDPYPPLLSQDKVDKAMADNKEKAMRELYNKFSADSFDGQILTRRDLMQCTENRPPLLFNDTGNRLFVMAWDSARLNDNSVIGIAELRMDPTKGWCMDIQNVVSLVDVKTKKKTPMIIPEQVKRFQELMLDYNGSDLGRLDWENIKAVVCDSGPGGQMVGGISDYMLADWTGKDGNTHKGIIDKSHKANETAQIKYENAVDLVHLIDPRRYRNEIFDAAEKMVKLGVVTFPADWDGKDELVRILDDGTEDRYALSSEEQVSLAQIELMKTEIITMCKYSTNGNITYNFPPDKRNTLHDDRVFVFALLAFYLATLRRNQIVSRQDDSDDWVSAPSCVSSITF